MPRASFRELRVRFRRETGFKKPLAREWPDYEKLASTFAKGELIKECGGVVKKNTTKRNFRRFQEKYESLAFRFVNGLVKKDSAAKATMFSSMGAGAQVLGEGHIYWLKDITGDDDNLQGEFDALSAREQLCATWLQETTRDFLFYGFEQMISRDIWTQIVEELRSRRLAEEELQWGAALELISDSLVNADARYLIESLLSLFREEASPLLMWVQDFRMLQDLVEEVGISIPQYLWYELFIGQVSTKETQAVHFELPKTHVERDAFTFDEYEEQVKKLAHSKMPRFHQSEVRDFTRRLLVPPDHIRNMTNGTTEKDEENKGLKWCRDCRKKHAKGKHTVEGDKRYQARKKERGTAQTSGSDKGGNITSAHVATPGKGGKPKGGKCYECGKEHYPFCRRTCSVCNKKYFPYCERKIKKEQTTNLVVKEDTADSSPTKGHASIAAAVESRLNELFMIRVKSDVCRLKAKVIGAEGATEEVVIGPDSMSSLSLARKKLVHGVHSEASGPVKGAWGEGHMNESGFLMIPHESKPGCYTPKAWVTDELPSDIDV